MPEELTQLVEFVVKFKGADLLKYPQPSQAHTVNFTDEEQAEMFSIAGSPGNTASSSKGETGRYAPTSPVGLLMAMLTYVLPASGQTAHEPFISSAATKTERQAKEPMK